MCFLGYETLCPMVLSNGITRNAGTGSRKRIEAVNVIEHVAKVQRVCRREVVVNAQAKLVPIIVESSAREKSICADIRLRKQTQQAQREGTLSQRIGRIWRRHLVEGIWLLEKDVKQLMI